jgi:hypothetical protein
VSWLKGLLSRDSKSRRKERPRPSDAIASDVKTRPQVDNDRSVSARQPVKQIVVGLDFGTSGTKVVVRDLWSNRAEPLMFADGSSTHAAFILPSAIRLDEGRLYFADAAEDRRCGGHLFRGFKMCMACDLGLNACQMSQCPNNAISEGRFRIIKTSENLVLSAKDLTVWYLAYVQGRIAEYLQSRYGHAADLKVWTNVGAPIDQESVAGAKAEFTRVAFLSQCLSDVVRNGIPLRDVMEAQTALESKSLLVPDETERTIFVQPETATGLMAFLKSTTAAPGLYAIVDVGAGTTDVSFFRLSLPVRFGISNIRMQTAGMGSEKMAFYEAKTQMVGSANIDNAVARLLAKGIALDHEILEHARTIKESFDDWSGTTSQRAVSKTEFIAAAAPTVDAIFDVYRRTNCAAFKKEAIQSRWGDFSVFLLGGGTRLSLVQAKFRDCKPSHVNRRITIERLASPGDLKIGDKVDFGMLAIGYGLSYAPVEFPTIFRPPEVEPLDARAAVAKMPDRDELYPK